MEIRQSMAYIIALLSLFVGMAILVRQLVKLLIKLFDEYEDNMRGPSF